VRVHFHVNRQPLPVLLILANRTALHHTPLQIVKEMKLSLSRF
jgi:hypothetical protein